MLVGHGSSDAELSLQALFAQAAPLSSSSLHKLIYARWAAAVSSPWFLGFSLSYYFFIFLFFVFLFFVFILFLFLNHSSLFSQVFCMCTFTYFPIFPHFTTLLPLILLTYFSVTQSQSEKVKTETMCDLIDSWMAGRTKVHKRELMRSLCRK